MWCFGWFKFSADDDRYWFFFYLLQPVIQESFLATHIHQRKNSATSLLRLVAGQHQACNSLVPKKSLLMVFLLKWSTVKHVCYIVHLVVLIARYAIIVWRNLITIVLGLGNVLEWYAALQSQYSVSSPVLVDICSFLCYCWHILNYHEIIISRVGYPRVLIGKFVSSSTCTIIKKMRIS